MLALVDPNPHNDINRNHSQCVYVLEGGEQVIGTNASPSSTAGNAEHLSKPLAKHDAVKHPR
eukprot:gene2224-1628_t